MVLKWEPGCALCVTLLGGMRHRHRRGKHVMSFLLCRCLNSWAPSEIPSDNLKLLERGQCSVPKNSLFVPATRMKFYKTTWGQRVHLCEAALPFKLWASASENSQFWFCSYTLRFIGVTSVLKNKFPLLVGKTCPCAELGYPHMEILLYQDKRYLNWLTKEQGSWSQSVSPYTTIFIKRCRGLG